MRNLLVTETDLPGVLVLSPQVFGDDRGFFFESFNARLFSEVTGVACQFVQDNHSQSKKGVLRGLHYQIEQAQGKLVRVLQGVIYDVVVDIRRGSPQFASWVGVELSSENKKQLWVPEGFAHGFLVLSDTAEVAYKTTDYYTPQFERAIIWNDPDLNICWPDVGCEPLLSDKDSNADAWCTAELPAFIP